jgi:ABC-type nitrate/sulfonate/bicarbonate transport system substrate-binding protein
MIVNAGPQNFDKKYGVDLRLLTLSWEEILPAVASASGGADVGFASLAEYLAKRDNLNHGATDPVLFIYPLYVYKGGGFITFNPSVPTLDQHSLTTATPVTEFLTKKIGAQKNSIYEMMVFTLARRANFDPKKIQLTDTPMNDGLLAAQQGSLDIASAGLTQSTEATKQSGRIVLTMEDLGFADITGLICKMSTLTQRRAEVEGLIRAWFDSVAFVLRDIDRNSAASLAYLNRTAATKYTLDQYKTALKQEYLPTTLSEAGQAFLSPQGQYSLGRISADMGAYLVSARGFSIAPDSPQPIDVK